MVSELQLRSHAYDTYGCRGCFRVQNVLTDGVYIH